MRCPVHCPPAGTMLARAVAVLAVAVAARLAYVMVASVVEAVALTILGSCVPASWAAWRAVRYGSLRKPRPAVEREAVRVTVHAGLVRAPYQIPALPLAIEGPKVSHPFAEVDWMRRCAHLDHPQANRCYLPRKAHTVAAPVVAAVVPGVTEGERAERWAGR